ncbi:MAG: peptidoglycan editing factor PgeF [Bacteroidales bacterium]|nr:peptidoglycan editing factor PgeF [Bacteroidales bacterium]MBN2749563.1 peptidoglycan editing factor PgeF [Bacteroidales bacterium]
MWFTLNSQPQIALFDNLSAQGSSLKHFVSTAFSPKGLLFNMSLNVGDSLDQVVANRESLAQGLGVELNQMVFANQVHGSEVALITAEQAGSGARALQSAIPNTDAMVTSTPGVMLVTLAADCVPILFFDPVKRAIGVAHAGWKGTVAKIPAQTIRAMQEHFGSVPSDILVSIGPSIGACCYEVGYDVVVAADKAFGAGNPFVLMDMEHSKPVFDLWKANLQSLTDVGVTLSNVEIASICTKCHADFFFSARNGHNGRFVAGIMLCE